MKHLILDCMNFMHRARSGFALGEHAVTYNFFRNLRALVGTLEPDTVTVVLEGHPRDRHAEFPEYKANREEKVDPSDPKSLARAAEMKSFYRQAEEAISLLKSSFPVLTVRHPHYEADDTIYTLCKKFAVAPDEVVVASNDTDFIQLLNEFPSDTLRLYNPHDKAYVEAPEYDYVTWKSLRGDPTDNIPNLPGVGNVTALKAVGNPEFMTELLSREGHAAQFESNKRLIALKEIPSDELGLMELSGEKPDWVNIIGEFKEWGFKSIFKDKTWEKFRCTFEALKPVRGYTAT